MNTLLLLGLGGAGLLGLAALKKKQEDDSLKPGMVGLLTSGGKQVGMVAVNHAGQLGWTNVLPAENANVRAGFPTGARATIVVGSKNFKAVANGDGPQGGRFFSQV